MATVFERRVLRLLATTKDILARSKWVVRCGEPDAMLHKASGSDAAPADQIAGR